jgi:galactose mutarotase-like enzyme
VDGQKLTTLTLDAGSRTTTFALDLGATLTTWPYETDVDEQWLLYLPDDQVLNYRSDGRYSLGPGNIEPGQQVWHLLVDSVGLP